MTKAADMIAKLDCLHVWPQSVADTYPDVLSLRQKQMLYEVGNVATAAATQIAAMKAAGDALAEYARHNIDCGFDIRHGYQSPCTCGLDEHKAAWSAANGH